jgi:hypothetical protein
MSNTIHSLVKAHGIDKLIFTFETDVFDQTTLVLAKNFGLPFGFTSGKTKRTQMIITEEDGQGDKLKDNYKVTFKSLYNNPLVPLSRFYICDFNARIEAGHVSVHKAEKDFLTPLVTTLEDIATEEEIKAKVYIEDNYFLLQRYLKE